MRNTNSGNIIRIIAGGYLAYLGYQIIRDGLMTGEMQGGQKVLGILFSILFIVVGIVFMVLSIRKLAQQRQAEEEEEDGNETILSDDSEAQEETEETPETPSLFDRARMGQEHEDETKLS